MRELACSPTAGVRVYLHRPKWRFLAVVINQGPWRIVAWALAKRCARLTRQVLDARA